ncbi:hypothetical protein A7U60_g1753 [Sanghuangporus baumii]|uniref:Uncharacterized protein n=1 Tax=Sanghuangporus baumii TaxID=108892 RepID=A0A9Q5NBE7_SANBA|nr:hypothetical protein A7U60_g1753 [Sanghuangporus baumii]
MVLVLVLILLVFAPVPRRINTHWASSALSHLIASPAAASLTTTALSHHNRTTTTPYHTVPHHTVPHHYRASRPLLCIAILALTQCPKNAWTTSRLSQACPAPSPAFHTQRGSTRSSCTTPLSAQTSPPRRQSTARAEVVVVTVKHGTPSAFDRRALFLSRAPAQSAICDLAEPGQRPADIFITSRECSFSHFPLSFFLFFFFAPALPASPPSISRFSTTPSVPTPAVITLSLLSLSSIIISRDVATHAALTREPRGRHSTLLSFPPCSRLSSLPLLFPSHTHPRSRDPYARALSPYTIACRLQTLAASSHSLKPRFTFSLFPSLLAYLVISFYAAHACTISFPFPSSHFAKWRYVCVGPFADDEDPRVSTVSTQVRANTKLYSSSSSHLDLASCTFLLSFTDVSLLFPSDLPSFRPPRLISSFLPAVFARVVAVTVIIHPFSLTPLFVNFYPMVFYSMRGFRVDHHHLSTSLFFVFVSSTFQNMIHHVAAPFNFFRASGAVFSRDSGIARGGAGDQ